jgi:hypothetical protein
LDPLQVVPTNDHSMGAGGRWVSCAKGRNLHIYFR